MPFKAQRIRDPIHNLIEFRANEFEDVLWRVIQTAPFQRLRRIKQLGFSDLVYPGATHSRFAHSVGVFHTARQLMTVVQSHLGNGYEQTKANIALAASLVHDVGHGPFMRRDRLMAGTRLAEIDFEWLIANLEVGTLPYGVDEKQVGTRSKVVQVLRCASSNYSRFWGHQS